MLTSIRFGGAGSRGLRRLLRCRDFRRVQEKHPTAWQRIMSIDPYSPCPGGTGKKVKFCCSDLGQELEKVTKLLEGEQPSACLDYVRKLDEKFPGRACLQSIRCNLENAVGDEVGAAKAVDSFLASHSSNPVALALKALQVAQEDVLAGIPWLQRAFEASSQEMPVQVYDATGALAAALLAEGHYLPARAHLQFQVGITQARDERALTSLLQFEAAPSIPILFKDSQALAAAPDGVNWKPEFQLSLESAQRGHWQRAAEGWTALTGKAGDSPELWRNLASVRGFLGNYQGAAEALRKYGSLNLSQDDAVEAEALAQLITKEDAHGQVDDLKVTIAVNNAEEVQEKLAADRRFERLPLDTSRWQEEDGPPPRVGYSLLAQPLPATGVGIAREAVPHSLAQMLLFGKQTDREARVELTVYRPELDAAQKVLRGVVGDLLGTVVEEEVVGHLTQVEHALSWHWRVPDDTPDNLRESLAVQQRRELVLHRWPTIGQPMFGGRSAEQAAGEPQYRLKLLAAIWLLQLSDTEGSADNYNELRRKLGLPEQADVDATGLDTNRIPLARLACLKPETLSDDQLKHAFNRVAVTGFTLALRRLAPEVVKRPGLPAVEYKLAAYRLLARMTRDPKEAIRLVTEARTLASANKQSCATWDLMELAASAQNSDGAAVGRLIDHVRRQHSREPGVLQSLVQLMVQLGLVTPDGRLMTPPTESQGTESPLVIPGAGAEPGKLWTPDAQQPSGEKKSSLWIPD
jgi:hypothetical protein